MLSDRIKISRSHSYMCSEGPSAATVPRRMAYAEGV